MAIRPESDRLDSVYCSKECQVKAKNQYQNLLFGLEPPLPLEMAPIIPPKLLEERNAAQVAFVNYLKRTVSAAPLLVAKFIARQVAIETAKISPVPISSPPADFPEADEGEYSLNDHVERLRYLEVSASSEEMKLLNDVLKYALPGLEQFVTEERHATLSGKMSYNTFGVCFSGGREDKVCYGSCPGSVLPSDGVTASVHRTSRKRGKNSYALRHVSSNRLRLLSRFLLRESIQCQPTFPTHARISYPDITLVQPQRPSVILQRHIRASSHRNTTSQKG